MNSLWLRVEYVLLSVMDTSVCMGTSVCVYGYRVEGVWWA